LQSEMGQGTVVTFFLPFELNAVKESSEQVSVNIVKPQVRRILLAEDDLVNAMFVETMLARIGCQVVVARDGKEALRKLREEFFDVVLMDVQMPIMDGVEATRIVRSWEGGVASIPIIALTAYAMCGDSEKFLAAGMNAYLTKPVSMQDIIRTIDHVMTENKSAQVEEIQCFSHQAGVLS